MTESNPDHRRYSEKEVTRLLKRATELQRALPVASASKGLTLSELEEVAAEAGLDPALLRQAAAELDVGSLPSAGSGIGVRLAGAPLRTVIERTLQGEVPVAAFTTMVPIIQMAADAPGQASQVGNTMTWQSQNPSSPRSLQILIAAHTGQTLIRIEERYGALAGGLFGGFVGGGTGISIGVGGAIGGALASAALAVALPLAITTSTYLVVRRVFRSIVRRRRGAIEKLLDTLADHAVQAIEAAGPGQLGPGRPSAPTLRSGPPGLH
jgi:hypothetical protein